MKYFSFILFVMFISQLDFSTAAVTTCNVGVNDDFAETLCSLSGSASAAFCSKIVLSSSSFGLDYTLRSCVVEVSLEFFLSLKGCLLFILPILVYLRDWCYCVDVLL